MSPRPKGPDPHYAKAGLKGRRRNTPAQAAASARNGRLGGRPRKIGSRRWKQAQKANKTAY